MLKQTKGFTLVEVVVVLVILGVLAGIAIPNVSGWVKDSEERRIISEAKIAVKTAEGITSKAYANDNTSQLNVLLAGSNIKKESGLEGEVRFVIPNDDENKKNEILHLTYENYDLIVTYCAYPDTCDDPKGHDEHYNFVEGTPGYEYPGEEEEEEPKEPEKPDPPEPEKPARDPNLAGFLVPDLQNNITIRVECIDVMNCLAEGKVPDVRNKLVSVNDGGVIKYYFLRPGFTIDKNMSEEDFAKSLREGAAKNKEKVVLIDTTSVVVHNNKIKYGQICIFTGTDKYMLFIGKTNDWNATGSYIVLSYDIMP